MWLLTLPWWVSGAIIQQRGSLLSNIPICLILTTPVFLEIGTMSQHGRSDVDDVVDTPNGLRAGIWLCNVRNENEVESICRTWEELLYLFGSSNTEADAISCPQGVGDEGVLELALFCIENKTFFYVRLRPVFESRDLLDLVGSLPKARPW